MIFSKLFNNEQKVAEAAKRTAAKRKSSATIKSRKQHEKINVKDLRVGMVVVELDKPWEESGFMFQSLELTSSNEIMAVQKECSFVWVDYDEYSLQDPKNPEQTSQHGHAMINTVEVSAEIQNASTVHSMASQAVSSLFEDIRLGEEIDGSVVKEAVNGCVDSIMRNQDASLWLTRIQAQDADTAQHSMNVSALSIIMGKSMGLNNLEMEDIGVCGMLHDVGKTKVPPHILETAEILSPEELAELQRHTSYGRDILQSSQNVIPGAADVAYSHHERPDGLGYPQGLVASEIPVYAKIVSIANAYDNLTTVQPFRPALTPSQALQELYQDRGKKFDEELLILFIDSVGIFPPGSIVEMVNKEVGIVLANTADKLRPRVIIILDSRGEPAMQRIVDISRMEADNEGNAYQIKTTHSDGAFGINVGDFQRAGLRMG